MTSKEEVNKAFGRLSRGKDNAWDKKAAKAVIRFRAKICADSMTDAEIRLAKAVIRFRAKICADSMTDAEIRLTIKALREVLVSRKHKGGAP